MASGTVKWFNNAKGYGFIAPDGDGDDGSKTELFAHFSSIETEGYRSLKDGARVEFEVEQGPKGPHAVRIRPVDDGPKAA